MARYQTSVILGNFPEWYYLLVYYLSLGMSIERCAEVLRVDRRSVYRALSSMREFLGIEDNRKLVEWFEQNGLTAEASRARGVTL